ncbi:hypothetical protein [Pseudomonas graminis]|uniref:Uncharacterized protein n=1 Tax=Pseudomonas graminis TaxID=158627 RepID=A0A1I0HYT6_9PSED|nr:hypothetical protein [Pseudomonas graminis]SET89387.1 hypothetical protein SAMN05216197_13110 [Pseudomonas graminis]
MEQTAAAKHAAAYRLRQKQKKAELGIATVTIEVAQGIAAQLPDFLKLHGFDNAQELYQTLVLYVLRAPKDEAAQILKPHTLGFVVNENLTRKLEAAGMAEVDPDAEE